MINIKDLYDKANSVVGISQKEFLTYVNEAILQLLSRYGEKYVFENTASIDILSVEDTADIYPEWKSPILHYVIYLKNGDQVRKQEYDSSHDYAYRTLWKARMRGRNRFRPSSWV